MVADSSMTGLIDECSGQSSSRDCQPFKGQTTPCIKHHNDHSIQGTHTNMVNFMRPQSSHFLSHSSR